MQWFSKLLSYPKLLALVLGVVSATGFAPLNLWPVTLIAFALLLHLIVTAPNGRAGFARGWLFGVGHFSLGLNWIATAFTFQAAMPVWLGWVAVVLLALYLAVYPALATWGVWIFRHVVVPAKEYRVEHAPHVQGSSGGRSDPILTSVGLGTPQKQVPAFAGTTGVATVLAFAALWIITEWLRSWVFSGFAWNPLGVILVPTGIAGPAIWIGTYGVSGIATLLAGCLYCVFQRQWRATGPILVGIALLTGGSVVVENLVESRGRARVADGNLDPFATIVVVQPNILQSNKWLENAEADNFRRLSKLTVAQNDGPRLIFWPEAAVPDFLESGYEPSYYHPMTPELSRAKLARLMNPDDVLVLGGLKLELDKKGNAIGARNSVFAMTADAKLGGSYDKSHLVPYGEYLPAREWLEPLGLSRLAPGSLDFWPGPGPRNINLGRFGTAGIQICYEMIFSGQVVDRANRPDFIFNPSNDAWFGPWGPPQHLAQAQLRAIEEAMPVIRSTPTGISAVIDSRGRILDSIPMGKEGRIEAGMPATGAPTLFAQYGNILPVSLALLLLLSAVAIARRRR